MPPSFERDKVTALEFGKAFCNARVVAGFGFFLKLEDHSARLRLACPPAVGAADR
jgi:hypothetical protein